MFPRSSRNRTDAAENRGVGPRRPPINPGSRGGRWHDPDFRRAYYRQWRADHPEYRERDRRRRLLAHALTRLVRVVPPPSPIIDKATKKPDHPARTE